MFMLSRQSVAAAYAAIIAFVMLPALALGIDPIGPVNSYVPGSDSRADAYVEFRENVLFDATTNFLPATSFLVNHTFNAPPPTFIPLNDPLKPDPQQGEPEPAEFVSFLPQNQIVLGIDTDVRMYFLSEEAAFSNSLGYTTDGSFDFMNGDLIFDRLDGPIDNGGNPEPGPLSQDAYVDLGFFTSGTEFDFFLVQDGADAAQAGWGVGANPLFWSDPAQNALGAGLDDTTENRTHTLTWSFTSGGYDYYVMGWEDQFLKLADFDPETGMFDASKIDYTDAIVVLQVTAVPEPGVYLSLGSFLVVVGFLRRRRTQAKTS